jgi:microcystin-dependent protein
MVSPPFNFNVNVPANTDIAANFPTLDRSDKATLLTWLTQQQNNYGINQVLTLVLINQTTNTTYGAGLTGGVGGQPIPGPGAIQLYYDADFTLKQSAGDLVALNSTLGPEYVGNPPGTIIAYAGNTTPDGYLFCDGAPISRTTYARLFTAIGTLWGGGDGTTTFNVPDLQSRTLFGYDPGGTGRISGGETDKVGNTGGNEAYTLTQVNLPPVDFVVTDGTMTLNFVTSSVWNLNAGGSGSGSGPYIAVDNKTNASYSSFVGFNTIITSAGDGVAASGGLSQPIELINPGAVVAYIIKF